MKASPELHIKNMVCDRCIKSVREELEKLGLTIKEIALGKVVLQKPADAAQLEKISQVLKEEGFELLDDKRAQLVEAIKNLVIEAVHYGDLSEQKENFSGYIAQRLHRDYNYLSNLFSEAENTTIEQFIIHQKIEKVKELLVYDELSLSQIAFQMGYSSTAHLSGQFKKITGFTPTQFKQLKEHRRKPLDKIMKDEEL